MSVTTASLPTGWKDRLVAFEDQEAGASRAVCLDPHDLVVSKLVAGREKDFVFARALLDAELVDADILVERARLLSGPFCGSPPSDRLDREGRFDLSLSRQASAPLW